MADITELSFVGDWRVTVVSKDAGWSQRVSATGTAAGGVALAGAPGASMDVFGDDRAPWTLRVEHHDGTSGWQPSWLRATSSLAGTRLEYVVESEDVTTSSSDRDFNDLVIRLDKLGLVSQPVPPFAILPENLQAMPEGIFEASLGRYFMAVRVTNIFTLAWPASARVGVSDRCRAWLAAAGVTIVDSWSASEQATLGQAVAAGRVQVGGLPPWASRLIYFKVDVSAAQVRKHQVELQVDSDQGAESTALISKRAKAPIQVSRTTYDATRNVFVSECDVGTLTAAIREMVVDHSTFKRAMGNARRIVRGQGGGTGPGAPRPGRGCDPRALERVRARLRAFLEGKDVDVCAIWRELVCCCAGPGTGDPGGGDWTGAKDPGLAFFVWPTVIDYTIDYRPAFAGQFGPIPYDDPFWKILLIILAILLSLAAMASSTADLANRGDDVVIGTLTGSILNALSADPGSDPASTDPGSIDAAVVTLNGNRSLTPAVFTELDAQSGEFFTATPIVAVDSKIDAAGTHLTNAQIDAIFQNLADNPSDPAAQAAVRVYKSGARSGLALGVMSSLVPRSPRSDHDGNVVWLLNQLRISQDADTTDALSCAGDSGSLWFQQGTNAVVGLNHAGPTDESGSFGIACRIEDVINQLRIRFA
jgi:hypothetical protein